MDELYERGAGESLRFVGEADGIASVLIQEEVTALNAELSLSEDLRVSVER